MKEFAIARHFLVGVMRADGVQDHECGQQNLEEKRRRRGATDKARGYWFAGKTLSRQMQPRRSAGVEIRPRATTSLLRWTITDAPVRAG